VQQEEGALSAGSPAKRESLGRSERLKHRPEFQAVFDRGRRASGRFLTVLVLPNRLGTARLGIVASRKLGSAVRRSRAKRRIRELFRQHKRNLGTAGLDVVIIPKRELLDAASSSLEADYRSVLHRHRRRDG
jgi:ribonuclease P protein component